MVFRDFEKLTIMTRTSFFGIFTRRIFFAHPFSMHDEAFSYCITLGGSMLILGGHIRTRTAFLIPSV